MATDEGPGLVRVYDGQGRLLRVIDPAAARAASAPVDRALRRSLLRFDIRRRRKRA